MATRLNLDTPDDADEARLDAAIHEYHMAAEAGGFAADAWLARQPVELRSALTDYVARQALLVRFQAPRPRTVPLALPDFHRYSRLRLVGKGGMGAVYRATDAVLQRDVAVKLIHADLAVEPADAERFHREARVMARLQHRNIIPVYDYGVMPGSPPRAYFTMQLVEGAEDAYRGKTLLAAARGHHDDPTPAGFQALVTAFLGVCDAVSHAHEAEVLHRDLKPANVLLLSAREVLVVDWGLSKVLTPDGRQTTGLGGTPEYMPPEVAQGATVGKPADVFGLGGVLAVVLTNSPVYAPTAGRSASEQAARADTSGCLARLRASGQPSELTGLAERCLAVAPAARPTAAEVAAAVVGYLNSVEERAKTAELNAVIAAELAKAERARRRSQGLLAVAAVVVVVVAGAVFGWLQG